MSEIPEDQRRRTNAEMFRRDHPVCDDEQVNSDNRACINLIMLGYGIYDATIGGIQITELGKRAAMAANERRKAAIRIVNDGKGKL